MAVENRSKNLKHVIRELRRAIPMFRLSRPMCATEAMAWSSSSFAFRRCSQV